MPALLSSAEPPLDAILGELVRLAFRAPAQSPSARQFLMELANAAPPAAPPMPRQESQSASPAPVARQESSESSQSLTSLPPGLRAQAREFLQGAVEFEYDVESAYSALMGALAYSDFGVAQLERVVGAASVLVSDEMSPADALSLAFRSGARGSRVSRVPSDRHVEAAVSLSGLAAEPSSVRFAPTPRYAAPSSPEFQAPDSTPRSTTLPAPAPTLQ